jgi:hypothetical protein
VALIVLGLGALVAACGAAAYLAARWLFT